MTSSSLKCWNVYYLDVLSEIESIKNLFDFRFHNKPNPEDNENAKEKYKERGMERKRERQCVCVCWGVYMHVWRV